MRVRLSLLGLLALIAAFAAVSSSSAAPAAAWGTAIQIPGIASLGDEADVNSLSCVTPGNCAAGGTYRDPLRHLQAYVVDETSGTWGTAIEVPGTAALNSGGIAVVLSVSCASPGNCAAGGFYADGSSDQSFVVDETDGTWGTAIEVPGTSTLNSGGYSHGGQVGVSSISCASAGNCAAVGDYIEEVRNVGGVDSFANRSFVVDEVDGTWNTAIELPGTASVAPEVRSVSCPTAGNCTAGGSYENGDDTSGHAFVVDEKNGVWGDAIEVPGTATANSGAVAGVESVSCATAGNCAAGGYYDDGTNHNQAFVVDETGGVWGTAITVPGTRAGNRDDYADVESVSCASPGDCSAGGLYGDGAVYRPERAFVVSETNGSWRTAIDVPVPGHDAAVMSVSCATSGSCAAGGGYVNRHGHVRAFLVDKTNGHWATAVEVTGVPPRDHDGGGGIHSVSCPAPGNCVGVGSYGRIGSVHPFAVNAHAAHASVSITPRKGLARAFVTVSGAGFAPGERVVVRYITGLALAKATICAATPDASGALVCSGRIPVTADAGRRGRHWIVARGSTGDHASTTFSRA